MFDGQFYPFQPLQFMDGLLSPPPIGVEEPKVLTYHTSAGQTNNGSFIGQAIGAASSDRRVIVGITGQGLALRTISGLTIGGIAATSLADIGAGTRRTALFIANVPTGTTADIVPAWSGSLADSAIGVWSATGLTSNTPHDADATSANPSTLTIDTLAGGFAVAFLGNTANTTATWTNLTERFDATVNSREYTGADTTTTGASLTSTVTPGSLGGSNGHVIASF